MIGALIAAAAFVYVVYFYWNASRYPRGPFPLPLIGNLHQMPMTNLHLHMHELGKQYGHCFTLFLPRPTVIFTDYAHIKEALIDNGEHFIGRSHAVPENMLQKEDQTGILIADGPVWREQRKAALRIMRASQGIMQEQISRSIAEMIKQIDDINVGKPIDMTLPLQLCVGNVINETLFGYHFKYDESTTFQHFVEKITFHLEYIRTSKSMLLLQSWPWMRVLPYIGKYGYDLPQENISDYQKFIEGEVLKVRDSYDPNHEPSNFVEAYLREMQRNPMLDLPNLFAVGVDFWLAGMETTSTTLRWSLLYLMKHPDVQEKIRQELAAVLGAGRAPALVDKPSLPYFTAALNELQRCANIVSHLLFHACTKDSVICGKFIPKGTLTMPQVFSVMYEDEYFTDPHEFRPERFLEDDGKTLNKKAMERQLVFGLGKRNCAGEGIARMELFLILGSLLSRYRIEAVAPLDFTAVYGTALEPQPYTCRLVRLQAE